MTIDHLMAWGHDVMPSRRYKKKRGRVSGKLVKVRKRYVRLLYEAALLVGPTYPYEKYIRCPMCTKKIILTERYRVRGRKVRLVIESPGLTIHHKRPQCSHPELRSEHTNLQALCEGCHKWVHR